MSAAQEPPAEPAGGDRLMQIGEVAERVRLSHRTVRHYDDEGLLTPTRSAGGFRLYTQADVQRLLLIRQLKPLGFTLDEMRGAISVLDRLRVTPADAAARAELREFLGVASGRRDRLAEQVATADAWLAELSAVLDGDATSP